MQKLKRVAKGAGAIQMALRRQEELYKAMEEEVKSLETETGEPRSTATREMLMARRALYRRDP